MSSDRQYLNERWSITPKKELAVKESNETSAKSES